MVLEYDIVSSFWVMGSHGRMSIVFTGVVMHEDTPVLLFLGSLALMNSN